jgi:hypothetical protein
MYRVPELFCIVDQSDHTTIIPQRDDGNAPLCFGFSDLPFAQTTTRRISRNSKSEDDWRNSSGRNSSFDQRMLRHSTGAKEEFLAPQVTEESAPITLQGKDASMLGIYFTMMVFIGLGNKIFNKLQTIPMHSTSPCPTSRGSLTFPRLPQLFELVDHEYVRAGE